MNKTFRCYYVWPKFPSISMSGNICKLHCKHCNQTYLNDMIWITDSKRLVEECRKLSECGCVGILLSGGCDENGRMLNLIKLLPAINQIKKETDLIIKLHAGLVDKKLAEYIVSAGIDIASVEVVGCNESIKEIFNFNATTESYKDTLENLESAGMKYIVPHVCIGLHKGKIKGEFNALKIIKSSCNPSVLVMIIFRPTKGTVLEKCKISPLEDISSVIKETKNLFPKKDVSLGCIRPRSKYREEIELTALDSGVSRMEIPSRKTIDAAKKRGYLIKNINACCALPEDLEYRLKKKVTIPPW